MSLFLQFCEHFLVLEIRISLWLLEATDIFLGDYLTFINILDQIQGWYHKIPIYRTKWYLTTHHKHASPANR